ncbi:MAG TPA: hypothetical protein VII46_07690, partial [Acidimicrobiales bacterium]
FGALTYAAHPEGILEYQKTRWTLRIQGLLFRTPDVPPGAVGGLPVGPVAPNGSGPGMAVALDPQTKPVGTDHG